MTRVGSKLSLSLLISLSCSLGTARPSTSAPAKPPSKPAKIARPTQYVLVAFDGGLNTEHWQKMREFAATMKKAKKPLNFTAFVSGVYFLSHNNKSMYAAPKHTPGYSMIGFAEDKGQFISNRVDQLNGAFKDGHEIASLANGHFDAHADQWSNEDWSSELKQYDDLLFGAFFNNKIQPNPTNKYPKGYAFESKDIVGFRAPYLGTTPGLYPALKSYGYTYDVSSVSDNVVWPTKDENGIWKLSIPMIPVAGTGKMIVNMDYNFYYVQSKGVDDLANREAYRKQMLDSYVNYFNGSYYGNRAPILISHHFEPYNGGAYWDAVQDFTKAICGKPEVKCITYKQYVGWLTTVKDDTLAAYRAGNFDALPRPKNLDYEPARALDVSLQIVKRGDKLEVIASGSDYQEELMRMVVKINGKSVPLKSLTLPLLRHHFPAGVQLEISAVLLNKKGLEIQRATHLLKDLGTAHEQFVQIPLEAHLLHQDLSEAFSE